MHWTLLAALPTLMGCSYVESRLADFRDVFTMDVGVGLGFGVDCQITDAVHSGLGGGLAFQWSLGRSRLHELDNEFTTFHSVESFLLYRSSGPMEAPNHQGFLWNALYLGDNLAAPPHGREWSGRKTELPLSKSASAPWINTLDVDIGVMILPVAARVGFSPGEALDLVLGIFGLDIAGDDGPREIPRAVAEPLRPLNPSFAVSMQSSRADLVAMGRRRGELQRPVLVLGGMMDSGLSRLWAVNLRKLIVEEQADMVIPITFASHWTFDSCRTGLLDVANEQLKKLRWSGPVDVVAVSMGGLVARYAAAPPEATATSSHQLSVRRVFTISTPHRGADMAGIPGMHPLARDMRASSLFMKRLEQLYPEADYELFPYVLTPDFVIGATNAAPAGVLPWWLPAPEFRSAHLGAMGDPRLLAEIARHLRGEPGRTTEPRSPLHGER